MLEKVTRPDGKEVTFAYDPLGRRISKTFGNTTTTFIWDGDKIIHECVESRTQNAIPSSTQNAISTWLFEDDSFTPIAKLTDNNSYTITTNHLGTPTAMLDESGNAVWEAELDLYGRPIKQRGGKTYDTECNFRFPGQYLDEEAGLYYNRFRYYDPELGMYTQQDPIGLAGGNPTVYGYVFDPLMWIDPLGLKRCPRNQKTRIEDGNAKEGWKHINERHVAGNSPKGAGDLFRSGTTRAQLQNAASRIVKKGQRVTPNANATVQTFQRKMSINGQRDLVRVVVDTKSNGVNRVITMFPVRGGF